MTGPRVDVPGDIDLGGPGGAPATPPMGEHNIEYVLSTQANAAIQSGKDPHLVTQRLGQMLTHLRANPDHAAAAQSALARGADPVAVAARTYELSNSATGHISDTPAPTAPTPPEAPGLLSRAGSKILSGATQMVTHPLDTITQAITAPVKSAFTATVAPGVGEARPDARLSKGGNASGRPIDLSAYDAQHGGVTNRERTVAGVQSLVNAAAPGMTRALPKALALPTVGAAEGAAYNPDDPAAGAMAGGVLTPAAGAVVKGVAGGTALAKTVRRVRAAEPLGETVARQSGANAIIDKANYGAAEAEGQANPSSSVVRDALEHPRVKPYADMFRASDEGATASDATTAREALKLMSRDQRALEQKMAIKGEYDAAADLKARDLKNARRMLKSAVASPGTAMRAPTTQEAIGDFQQQAATSAERATALREMQANAPEVMARETAETPAQRDARVALERHAGTDGRAPLPAVAPAPTLRTQDTPPVMPSLPNAIGEHARTMGNRQAFDLGADQTRRILQGTPIRAKKLDTQGGPAFMEQIQHEMTPEQASHATTGTLGRTNELTKYHAPDHHTTAFGAVAGAVRPIVKINTMRPYLDALDAKSGVKRPSALNVNDLLANMGMLPAGLQRDPNTP